MFFTSAGSAFALYGKIKLHGNIMHKVPMARSISDNYERTPRTNDLDSIFKKYQDSLDFESTDSNFNYVLSDTDADGDIQPYAQGRVSEYEMGIYFYRALIGSNWKDGWLFPVWASSVNPYHQGSKSFIDLAMGEAAMSKTEIPVERKTISAFIKDKLNHGRKHCHAKAYVNSSVLIKDSDISFLIKRSSCSEVKNSDKEFF